MSLVQQHTSIPRDGLEGEWLLDGDALDTSGGGNDGTATNVTYVDSEVGFQNEVGSFNGSSSVIDTGYKFNATEVTMSCWIKTSYTPTDNDGIISNYDAGTPGEHMGIRINTDGKLYGYADDNVNATWGVLSNSSINTGKWVYCTYQFKANDYIKIYINGKLETNQSVTTGIVDNFRNWFIGKDGEFDYYFNGQIGLARIYNRVLTESEIQALYLEGKRKLGQKNYPQLMQGLVGYWDFRGDASDVSGNGNDGTVTGATLTTDHLGNANSAYSFTNADEIDIGNIYSSNFSAFMLVNPSEGVSFLGKHPGGGNVDFTFETTRLAMYDGTYTAVDYSGNPIITDGNYHLVGFTFDGTTAKIYVDGLLHTSGAFRYYNSGGPTGIGTYGDYIGNCSLLILGETLSADEVKALYELTSSKYIYPWTKSSLPNLQDGLVLDISGKNNGTTFYDQSGNSNDGTQSGGVTTSRVGQHEIMSFDGVDDYINTGVIQGTGGDLTIRGRVMLESYTGASQNMLITLSATLDDYNEITIRSDNDDNRWECRITGSSYSEISVINITPKAEIGRWYDVSLSYDRSNDILRLYIDGVKVGENISIPFKLSSYNKSLMLSASTILTQYSNSNLSDIKIYNRALSPTEVQQLYYSNYIQ